MTNVPYTNPTHETRTPHPEPTTNHRAPFIIGTILAGATLTLAFAVSFESQRRLGLSEFGPVTATAWALLPDTLILVAGVMLLAGALTGRTVGLWRTLTHLGVALTVVTNVLAASSPAAIPLHLAAPLGVAAIVEGLLRQATRHRQATEPDEETTGQPLALWIAAPGRTWRTLIISRAQSGGARAVGHRVQAADVERARVYLDVVCSGRGRDGRTVRRTLRRSLASGVQTPASVVSALLAADGLSGSAWVLAAVRPAVPVPVPSGPVPVSSGTVPVPSGPVPVLDGRVVDELAVLEREGWSVSRALAVLGPSASRSRLYRLRAAHMPTVEAV